MICAAKASSLLPLERGVVGHELLLGAVAREAHDDHSAGLDPHHDALPKAGVDHVVTERERGARRGLLARRRGRRRAGPGAPARKRGAWLLLLLDVGEVARQLVEEAT